MILLNHDKFGLLPNEAVLLSASHSDCALEVCLVGSVLHDDLKPNLSPELSNCTTTKVSAQERQQKA